MITNGLQMNTNGLQMDFGCKNISFYVIKQHYKWTTNDYKWTTNDYKWTTNGFLVRKQGGNHGADYHAEQSKFDNASSSTSIISETGARFKDASMISRALTATRIVLP